MKITARIATWLLLLVLIPMVPLLGLTAYSATRLVEGRRAAIEGELVQRANALASAVNDRLARILGYMNSLAVSNAAMRDDVQAIYDFARRISNIDPEVAAVTLIAPDNRMLFLTLRPYGQQFPTAEVAAVRQVFETGKPVLSAPFKAPISDRRVIALGVPVVRDGKVVYCLRAIFGADMLNALLEKSSLPPDWIGAVVGGDGVLAARSQEAERFVGQPAAPALVAALRNGTTGVWNGVSKEGIPTRSVLLPVGDWGWYVALGVPTETLLAPLWRDMRNYLLVGLALLLVAAAGAIFLARRIRQSLLHTAEATRAVLRGTMPEVRETGVAELDQMRDTMTTLDAYGRVLEQEVAQRTREVVEARDRIAQFAQQLDQTIEGERLRISREVHDQIGAVLTGLKMIIRGLRPGTLPADQEKNLLEALDVGVATARRIAGELRPPLIDDLGVEAALEQLLESMLRPAGIVHSVRMEAGERLPAPVALGAYRIVQEACTNVIRHAHAQHFTVDGAPAGDDHYTITLRDDGTGLPEAPPRPGALGMQGMHERARLMGGVLECVSRPQYGVTLTLRLPIVASASHEDPAA